MRPYSGIALLFVFVLFGCAKDTPSDTNQKAEVQTVLGELQHGFTLNANTQAKFDEGLLLLHNFEYDDALKAFEEATAQDSTEILTHWGEAMCHYKALWRLQNTEKGSAIVSRLGKSKEERMTAISDPIEKEMWELIEIMYGEGEFEDRNKKIKTHLEKLHSKYPQHQEIAAFYALSLIWSTEEYGDGSEDLRLAASIADKVTKINPLHPGALHYKIHALDGPTSAEDALAAADAYAQVAADAAHALHMPSHIFLALGQWEKVVNSNQASYEASVQRMVDQELKDGARGYHSLAWLHYGLLQQGKYAQAEKILNEMLVHVPKDPTKGARGYLIGMQSRQLLESGKIGAQTNLDLDTEVEDIGIEAKALRSFLRAQLAFESKEVNLINDELNWLRTKIDAASQIIDKNGAAMCAAGNSRYAPSENSIKISEVIVAQIEGLKALLEGNKNDFEMHLKRAVAFEDQTNFPAGPPKIAKPSYEQYGEWLLTQGRYAEAIKLFDKALHRMPNRAKSLIGKFRALRKLNQLNDAKSVRSQLETVLASADDEVLDFMEE